MSRSSSSSSPTASTSRVRRFKPPAVHIAWLQVTYSDRYGLAPWFGVQDRLRRHLADTGLQVACTPKWITVLRAPRPLLPADWCEVLDWLMRQPEVILVVRILPRSLAREVRHGAR
jgi:hypothetical protein